MKDIFLSRPTYIPQKQRNGLEKFCALLDLMDFSPRTLGATDYPNEAPLDEILRMLDSCSGMIVLGFPQLYVEVGFLKEEEITNHLKLATEWNQIEAALAYSRNMPLLIIHDKGVSRGIFDHGSLGNFIHEVDFNDVNWSDEQSIRGALKTWKEKVANYVKISADTLNSAELKIQLNALKNDFFDILNQTRYCRKKNKSQLYVYSSYKNEHGKDTPLCGFLVRELETWYEQQMKRCGNKIKNDILNEINQKFPQVYEKIRLLFEKDSFDACELEQCFVI